MRSNSEKSPIQKRHFFYCVVAPLTLGILVYWLFRGIPYLSIAPIFRTAYHNDPVISFIAFNIQDGLWLYALLSSLRIIWHNHSPVLEQHWVLTAIFLTMVAELLQFYSIVPGTYDILDIGVYIITSLTFYLSQQHNNQNTKNIIL